MKLKFIIGICVVVILLVSSVVISSRNYERNFFSGDGMVMRASSDQPISFEVLEMTAVNLNVNPTQLFSEDNIAVDGVLYKKVSNEDALRYEEDWKLYLDEKSYMLFLSQEYNGYRDVALTSDVSLNDLCSTDSCIWRITKDAKQ